MSTTRHPGRCRRHRETASNASNASNPSTALEALELAKKVQNQPKSAKTRQRGSMKSNERKETLGQHQQRTSAVPEDLSRRAKTRSALTTLDSVTFDVNYLSRLVL